MYLNVVGVEVVDYISRKTGQPVKGTNLHCTYPADYDSTNAKVTGTRVERLYVPERVRVDGIVPGDGVEVYFNRYGSVDSVSLTEPKK